MKSVFFESSYDVNSDFPFYDYEVENINFYSHFHEEIEIVVVIDGSVDIVCENYCFTATKDDIVVIMPGEIHSFASPIPNKIEIFKLNCKNSQKKTDFKVLRFDEQLIKKSSNLNRELRILTDKLVLELKKRNTGYEFMANSISQEILVCLLRSNKLHRIDAEEKNKLFFYTDLLSKVNSYIDSHFSEPILLKDICNHCNLSEYYFAHIFKQVTNFTFVNYLTAYRLEKSLPLLLHSDKKIIDVALECGFFNTRSFNRAFQKFFSMTPSEYRIKKGLVS